MVAKRKGYSRLIRRSHSIAKALHELADVINFQDSEPDTIQVIESMILGQLLDAGFGRQLQEFFLRVENIATWYTITQEDVDQLNRLAQALWEEIESITQDRPIFELKLVSTNNNAVANQDTARRVLKIAYSRRYRKTADLP